MTTRHKPVRSVTQSCTDERSSVYAARRCQHTVGAFFFNGPDRPGPVSRRNRWSWANRSGPRKKERSQSLLTGYFVRRRKTCGIQQPQTTLTDNALHSSRAVEKERSQHTVHHPAEPFSQSQSGRVSSQTHDTVTSRVRPHALVFAITDIVHHFLHSTAISHRNMVLRWIIFILLYAAGISAVFFLLQLRKSTCVYYCQLLD